MQSAPTFQSHHPNPREILVNMARACLWGLVLALLPLVVRAPKRRLLRKLVCKAESYLEAIVMLLAMERVAPPPRSRTPKAPASAPIGFRRAKRRAGHLRSFTHKLGLRLPGALHARLEHVRDVLANPERYVARLAKRLARGLRAPRLIATAPPAILLAARIASQTPALSDSS
jgi:hypothetical protein